MTSDPKIDYEAIKKWKANTLPVPSAELLKGEGSGASNCSAWKPINDDALDGQIRILSDGGRVMTGAWEPNNAGGFSWFSEDSKILPMQPTHWMPLPEPPTENDQ